jgi:hypothetical protein
LHACQQLDPSGTTRSLSIYATLFTESFACFVDVFVEIDDQPVEPCVSSELSVSDRKKKIFFHSEILSKLLRHEQFVQFLLTCDMVSGIGIRQ